MKPYSLIIVHIILLSLFVGCKISKDISVPKADLPQTYRNGNSTDAGGIGGMPLNNFFTNNDIKALIDTALVKNYDLQLAMKNIESAELMFSQSRLGNLPELNLQLTGSSNLPSDNSINGLSAGQFLDTKTIQDFNATAVFFWEADIWGKISSRKQAALALYLKTEEAKNTIQTRLIANVAHGYYRLLMMDAQMKIARQNLALNDSTLHMIQMQFQAGQVTSLDIQQAKAQRLVAAQLIPRLEQDITIQENALRILTGRIPGAVNRLGSLEETRMPDKLSSGIPSEMLGRRPDIKSAELSLDLANAKVGIAKANMYPTLIITASGGLNSFKASNWFNVPASLFGIVTGGITAPVFQQKKLRTQYESAKIEREQAVIQFRQSVLNAVGEVSDELIKIEKLKDQYNILSERVNTLQQTVNNAHLLFKNGLATYLEVITAQTNYLQSELELAAIKTAQLNASVELYRSLGGGVL